MNKILSLCINCLLLVISDAVPVKLIAGDRSVVKKDGATHTISKYYVVPNDYDPNNVTNTTTASATQKAAVRMHSLYTKSMASGIIDEEINENKATTVNDQSHSNVTVEIKNPQVNFGSDLNVGQGEVTNQLDDSTESTVSMSTEQSLDSDDLGNLQVEPIIDPININRKFTDEININVNSGEAVQNGSPFIIINETEPTDIEDKLDDFILTKFGVAVHERYSQNLESYWKLIKLNVDRNSGDDELLAAVEKLSLLLNIFTNLYEASQLKKPVAKMIDGIIEILQIPFVEKSIGKEIQAETNISGDYDEECLRKCVRRSSKQQLDSNGTSLSETEGRQASDSSELENLQRRHRGDSDDKDLIKMSDDPDSNQLADSNEPITVLRSQLSHPYNLNVGVPDGYNALTSETTLTLDDVARNNYIQKDLYSMEMIPDSKETVENLDDQPMTIESRIIDVQPLTIKSRTADDLPSTIEDKKTEYFSWTSQNIPDDGLPWHIEDKTSAHHPFMIEHRTTNKLPWSIESRTDPTWASEEKNTEYFPWPSETTPNDGLPWHIEDKTSAHHPFMIEHRTTNKLPWSIKSRTDPTWTSEEKNTEYFPWPSETTPNDGLPWHIEDKTSAHHPFMIEHRTTNKLPWSIKSRTDPTWTSEEKNTEYFPWPSETTPNDGLPWHIEEKTSAHHPFMIEHRTTNKLPWSIKSRTDPTWASEEKNTEYFLWPSETTPNDGLPWHIEDKTSAHHPFMIEHRTTNKLPWSIKSRQDPTWTTEDENTEYFPWPSETTPNDGLPWHIEDKTSAHHPFMIEHRTTNKLPWSIKSKTEPTWTIKNKMDHSPITATALFQSGDPSVTTHGRNIIFNPNQPIKSTVHNVINRTKKPYHIYTYVINPTTPLYKVPNAGNGAQMVSRQPYENLETTLHALPTLHGGNQVVYENQPSRSQYEPQYSLSKPTIDISSQPSYSQLTHTNYPTKTYDANHEVNPSTLHSQTPQEDNELQYLVGHGSEINHKPALLQSNTLHSESQPNSGEENEAPTVPEIDSLPGDLLMNVPSNPFGSMISHGNTEPDSTESANSTGSVVTSDVDPNIDDQHTQPNSYNPNDNGNLIQPSTNPAILNKARQSAHASVQTSQYPGFFSSSASSSTYTNDPDEPDYGGQIHQQPDTISTASAHSETNVQDDYDVHTPVYKEDTNNYPGFISQATAHSEYTNVPKDYTNLAPDNGQYTYTRPGQISKVHQYLVHPNVWDDSIPVNGIQIQKHPGYISKASSHSKFNVPVNYNVPTQDYGDDTDFHPGKIQNFRDYSEINHHTKVQPVNSGPTQYGDNYLVPYQPYVHKVHVIHQPHVINHLIQTIPGNQNLKLKLAPTYRLLTVQNLKNLENAIIKTIQMYGAGVHDDRALINLKNIIKIILLLAENLEETGGTNPWYENIFYNSQHSQHPLQTYVYKLIRQRWLHELMLVLYKNNFSTNILQHPGIFSFLESWQFPNYVQDFMKSEELTHVPNPQDYDDMSYNQNDLQNKFSTHTYGDLFKDVPENLEKYVTDNYFDSYKSPNDGIVVSIGGVEAQPDANVIIQILQNYLHHKSNIETQEDVIIRDNKVEMLKQIILFLKEKGYGPNTIADLIRKLYSAVYSTEGRGCHTHHTNFAKNMYDVILPVLRRSGR